MGPSCAGKSTLSKYVCAELEYKTHKKWQRVDFDDVEENMHNLIATINNYLQDNSNVIVDTNTYESGMESNFHGASIITKILITSPLEILLQRYEKRMQSRARNKKRALRARNFVIHSFNKSLTWPHDFMLDTSQQSVAESGDIIVDFLINKEFFLF